MLDSQGTEVADRLSAHAHPFLGHPSHDRLDILFLTGPGVFCNQAGLVLIDRVDDGDCG